MLDNPKAKQALDEFVSQWMRFDRVLTSTKDRRRFPQFTRETAIGHDGGDAPLHLRPDVGRRRISRSSSPLNTAIVNADLAGIYGVPAPATEFDRVNFPADSERAGLLGQALFLALSAKPDETSPTARGLFVREQFLCQHVADPPPGVNTNLPPVSEAKPQTNRERLAEHTLNKSCAGCHNLIDPIGFGFEKFDAIGAPAREDAAPASIGERRESRDAAEDGRARSRHHGVCCRYREIAISLRRRNSAQCWRRSPQCQECMVKQYFRYTAGRIETPGDRPLIRKVAEDFRRSKFRFKEMIISMVRSREFPGEGGPVRVASNH